MSFSKPMSVFDYNFKCLLLNLLANEMEPSRVGGTKAYLRHLGLMKWMAAMPIYGKNSSNTFILNFVTIFCEAVLTCIHNLCFRAKIKK